MSEAEKSLHFRDQIEAEIRVAVDGFVRGFLTWYRDSLTGALPGLTAAASDPAEYPKPTGKQPYVPPVRGELPVLGEVSGAWATLLASSEVENAVRRAFTRAYNRYSAGGLRMDSPALAAMEGWVSRVRDRLVTGTYFGVPVTVESFELIRETIALSVAEGWPRGQLAERIAVTLDWAPNTPYWRTQLEAVNSRIDAALDKIGPPGNPVREATRLHDPRIAALQADRSRIVLRMDAERSIWEARATLIARTEATSVANYGGLSALTYEGVETKVWVSAGDARTRDTHREAVWQEVPITGKFAVGAALLAYPGDPTGPPEEVCNCRCTIIGGGALDLMPPDF